MTEKECCNMCRFYFAQHCRRHAPVYIDDSRPCGYPWIFEAWEHWCGDYERKPEPEVTVG